MGESLDGVFFGFSSGVSSLLSFISLSFGESGSRWDIRIFSSLSSGEEMSGLITEAREQGSCDLKSNLMAQ